MILNLSDDYVELSVPNKHALSKHAGRKPEIWGGKIKGNMTTWNEQGMKHFNEIVNSQGKFKRVVSEKSIEFIEKNYQMEEE